MQRSKKIDEMDIGELELELHRHFQARIGGIIMVAFTIPFIVLCWFIQFGIGYWFFAICLLIWTTQTFYVQYEIDKIRNRIKDELGVNND